MIFDDQTTWELGHIVPADFFNHQNDEDLKLCWNYKNLIPMTQADNKMIGSCPLFAQLYFKNDPDSPYLKVIQNHISSIKLYIADANI